MLKIREMSHVLVPFVTSQYPKKTENYEKLKKIERKMSIKQHLNL